MHTKFSGHHCKHGVWPAASAGGSRRSWPGKQSTRQWRTGVACVEFAVVAPVLVIITLSIIDTCNVIHLKQKINTVAFETVRIASFEDETFDSARGKGLTFALARGISNPRILVESFEPNNFPTRASLPLGFTLRAQVEVQVSGNVPGPFLLFRGASIRSQLVRMSAR